MKVESASTFLASVILSGAGFTLICVVLVIINNLFAKYWKPVNLWYFTPKLFDYSLPRFGTIEETNQVSPRLEPELNNTVNSTKEK